MKTYGPYSPITKAGNIYFTSGQVGIDPDTHEAKPDVASQTAQTLENLRNLLESNGLSMGRVVKTTIFLKNINDFIKMNKVYLEFFNEPRPARSCVEVSSLPNLADNELLIEIEAVAYKP